jgi:hypothetical protein
MRIIAVNDDLHNTIATALRCAERTCEQTPLPLPRSASIYREALRDWNAAEVFKGDEDRAAIGKLWAKLILERAPAELGVTKLCPR